MEVSKKRAFVKNSSWLIGGKIAHMVISLIISMITARYLGPSNYGLLNYAASFAAFATPLCTLGLTSIMVNEIINKEEQTGTILGTAITLRIASSVLSIVGIFLVAFCLNYNEVDTIIVVLLYSFSLLFQAFDSINYFFQAKLLSKYPTIVTLIAYLIVCSYKVVLLILNKSVEWFALSYVVDYFCIALFLFIVYKIKHGPKLSFSLKTAKHLFSRGYHFILSGLMVAIYGQTDKIMLKSMLNSNAVGFYSTANAVCVIWVFLLSAIIESARPLILEKHKDDKEAFEFRLTRLYSSIIYISFLVSILFCIFAEPVIMFLYGNDYLPSVGCLRILTWATAFSYLGVARSIWMVPEEKQKYEKFIAAGGAVCNVLLNLALIPLIGVEGAAVATLITQLITNFIIGFIIRPIRRNSVLILKAFNPKVILSLIPKQKEEIDPNKRISVAFNVLKCICILLIICAHVNVSSFGLLGTIMNNFGIIGVPLFLICSGYYYKKKPFFNMLKSKFFSIVIPWLFLGSIVFLINALLLKEGISFSSYVQWMLGYKTYLYYVIVLLVCFVVFYHNCLISNIVFVLLSIVSIIATYYYGLGDFLSSIGLTNYLNVFNWFGFFALGLLLKRVDAARFLFFLRKSRFLFGVFWALITVYIACFNYKLSYFSLNGIFYEMISFFTVLGLGTIIKSENLVVSIMSKTTYPIYILHMALVGLCGKIYQLHVTTACIANIIVYIITIVLVLLGYFVFKKIKHTRIYSIFTGCRL